MITEKEIIGAGGAIAFPNASQSVTIVGCLFQNNKAEQGNGGCLYFAKDPGALTITDTIFQGGTAVDAGCMGSSGIVTSITIDNVTVDSCPGRCGMVAVRFR